MVVGAYALASYVEPRSTGDIDIWIRPDPSNAVRVWNALASFGAPISNISVDQIAKPGFGYQIGVAPVRIDILTEIDGVTFEEAWNERKLLNFEGVTVPVISRRHLLLNKKAAGRPKDLADVASLEEDALNEESRDDA